MLTQSSENHPSITIRFPANCQIWQIAADAKENRTILQCVHVHPAGYLMATDTKGAAIVPCEIEGAPDNWGGALVPATFIKDVMKECRMAVCEFTIEGAQALARTRKGGTIMEPLQEGTFPRLDMILKHARDEKDDNPTHPAVRAVSLNPWLMAKVAQAIGCEKSDMCPVSHEWSKASRAVLIYPNDMQSGCVGILMPGSDEVAKNAARKGEETLGEIIGRLTALPGKAKVAA